MSTTFYQPTALHYFSVYLCERKSAERLIIIRETVNRTRHRKCKLGAID